MLIANYTIDSACNEYKVCLYPEKAEVWVVKTHRRTGNCHWQAIKHGSSIFKRVLRDLRLRSQPGSLSAEQLSQCSDTA